MHSLLTPAKRREETPPAPAPSIPTPVSEAGGAFELTDAQVGVLNAMRTTLNEFGVDGEPQEIVQVMVEALLLRPMLCRGLLAAYLTEGE